MSRMLRNMSKCFVGGMIVEADATADGVGIAVVRKSSASNADRRNRSETVLEETSNDGTHRQPPLLMVWWMKKRMRKQLERLE